MQHRVLVVDDEPQITDVLKQFLESEDYEVFTAGSAEEALVILKENIIDVVLSDESMPGMSGTTFLGIVRSEFPDTIRILLTGLTDFDTAINAINIGEIYRFFTKPCNFKELRVTLRQAIQQKELISETRRLLIAYKQQAALLRSLEQRFPGMTRIDKTSTGSIIIDGQGEDFETFFRDLKKEVARAEGYKEELPTHSTKGKMQHAEAPPLSEK
jgi:DNA-binding NtrC family response regulator